MSSRDERFWITFNDEIYNFIGLRAELERTGEVFYTTEVLLRERIPCGCPVVGSGNLCDCARGGHVSRQTCCVDAFRRTRRGRDAGNRIAGADGKRRCFGRENEGNLRSLLQI